MLVLTYKGHREKKSLNGQIKLSVKCFAQALLVKKRRPTLNAHKH